MPEAHYSMPKAGIEVHSRVGMKLRLKAGIYSILGQD